VDATHEQWADGFNLPDNFFSTPCLGCVGNLGRNTFVGPGYFLVARHLKTADDLFDSKPSRRTESMVAAAVQWAERIMRKIDNLYSR